VSEFETNYEKISDKGLIHARLPAAALTLARKRFFFSCEKKKAAQNKKTKQ
jgi:hypothetical protein